MKFLIDENVGFEVTEYLVAKGHDVKRVPISSKNGEVIALASKEHRILITSDAHFSNILIYPPHKTYGIIRLKIHPPSAAKEINALNRLFAKLSSPSEFNRRLLILEEDDFRVRR